ncbi:MAG: hypothetical protein M3186_05995, partial [Actinomycetota bacterium]|nr:hypothetical protein [Actinomycetota bacterium]
MALRPLHPKEKECLTTRHRLVPDATVVSRRGVLAGTAGVLGASLLGEPVAWAASSPLPPRSGRIQEPFSLGVASG